jgi:xanthine dehydrogenase YagR molybdenum-binding subunit
MAEEKVKDTRRETMTVGIAGAKLTAEPRELPAGEPPPLPPNAELKVIGKRTPRLDGRLKVTGGAKYTADIRLPGMLYARMITAPHPHARIASLDTTAAAAYPGVRAVHVLDRFDKDPVVRYAGQPVAAVAAISQAAADDAARLVRISWEPLPFVADIEAARAANAPLVFPPNPDDKVPRTGNVRGPVKRGPQGKPKGDAEKALSEAPLVVDHTFRTQVQTHCTLETHGVVADWQPDSALVYTSTQATVRFRDELAEVFGIPKARIRVISEYMGGGFGSKLGMGPYGVLALHLSKKAGRPVRLMLDRREEQLCTGNRPSSVQRLRLGATPDGKLTAIHLSMYGSGGVAGGAGGAGPAQNMYDCPNVTTEESDVFMHSGPSAAMRAPGHPQGCFALEQSIDALAEKLGIDPLRLRDLNDSKAARREERRIGAEMIGWSARRKPAADKGPVKRGMGMAQSVWYRIVVPDSSCEVRLDRQGSVEIVSAIQDIGTGIRTVLAQVVAEELGLKPEQIIVRIGDTAFPLAPSSGGSLTTGSITPAARNAANRVRMQLLDTAAPLLKASAAELDLRDGRVVVKSDPARGVSFADAAAKIVADQLTARVRRSEDYALVDGQTGEPQVQFLGGVQFAQVAVDTETGAIKVERVVAVHDCGRPMNPLTAESQIKGGIIQGISYALLEDRTLDRNVGLMVNPNLEMYKIAGSRETPKIDVHLIEEYLGRSSTDAAGVGEPSTIPTAAAVANAVYNATGVRMLELPMTPDRVLSALRAARS